MTATLERPAVPAVPQLEIPREGPYKILFERLQRLVHEAGGSPTLVIMTGSSVTNNVFRASMLEERLASATDRPQDFDRAMRGIS